MMVKKLKKFIRPILYGKEWKKIRETVARYRNFDEYELDVVRKEGLEIHIDQKLPSEPPEGITYRFGPSGYITEGKNPDYCIIHTQHHSPNNYCHWTLRELPWLCLALESSANFVVVPDVLLNGDQAFQKRWWEILRKKYGHKTIIPLSGLPGGIDGIIPVNHDTSSSKLMVGKCEYSYYHTSRATPYCLEVLEELKHEFTLSPELDIPRFYINRKTRRLKNEEAIQEYLSAQGIDILNLEDFSLDQQVQLFSQAELVIGFHGAGLANTAYCSPQARVIEIADPDCVYPSYRDGLVIPSKKATRTYFHMLAEMKGLHYTALTSRDYFLDPENLSVSLEPVAGGQ